MAETTMPEVLTLEAAARFLKLSPEAVAHEGEAGQIPGRRVARSWRFLLSALEDWQGRQPDAVGEGGWVFAGS